MKSKKALHECRFCSAPGWLCHSHAKELEGERDRLRAVLGELQRKLNVAMENGGAYWDERLKARAEKAEADRDRYRAALREIVTGYPCTDCQSAGAWSRALRRHEIDPAELSDES